MENKNLPLDKWNEFSFTQVNKALILGQGSVLTHKFTIVTTNPHGVKYAHIFIAYDNKPTPVHLEIKVQLSKEGDFSFDSKGEIRRLNENLFNHYAGLLMESIRIVDIETNIENALSELGLTPVYTSSKEMIITSSQKARKVADFLTQELHQSGNDFFISDYIK